MQAPAILTETQHLPAIQSAFEGEVSADLEATTPEEEFEAWLGEQAMWDGYFSDRGV